MPHANASELIFRVATLCWAMCKGWAGGGGGGFLDLSVGSSEPCRALAKVCWGKNQAVPAPADAPVPVDPNIGA